MNIGSDNGKQLLHELKDLIVISHPEEKLEDNIIELKSLETYNEFKKIISNTSEYPADLLKDPRIYGFHVNLETITQIVNNKQTIVGFEVHVCDIPNYKRLSTDNNKKMPATVIRSFQFIKNATTNNLMYFKMFYVLEGNEP